MSEKLAKIYDKIDNARTQLHVARIAGSINDTKKEVSAMSKADELLFEACCDIEEIQKEVK